MKRVFLRILAYALCVTLLLGALPARASVVQYDLFITSVRVTEENRGDILGDGVFRFDGDRTLVVCGDCDSPDLPVISSGIPGLVIRVQKPSTLSCGENPAILALADLTLTGPAALALESENCGVFMRSCSLTVSALCLPPVDGASPATRSRMKTAPCGSTAPISTSRAPTAPSATSPRASSWTAAPSPPRQTMCWGITP